MTAEIEIVFTAPATWIVISTAALGVYRYWDHILDAIEHRDYRGWGQSRGRRAGGR